MCFWRIIDRLLSWIEYPNEEINDLSRKQSSSYSFSNYLLEQEEDGT